MKTHILKLDPHDDVTSTLDKMGWGKSGRILLVWPDRERVLTRKLDIVLLRRRSLDLGSQLALVCRDSDVRFHARQLGIPVFNTLQKAEKSHWKVSRYTRYPRLPTTEQWLRARRDRKQVEVGKPPPDSTAPHLSPPLRLFFFTLGVLALLAIAAVLLPSAVVAIEPETRTQEIILPVVASPDTNLLSEAGTVPVKVLSIIIEGRDSITATGSIQLPDRPAYGSVEFTNLTTHAITIPINTVVSTIAADPGAADPIRYTTILTRVVEAGLNKTVTAPVQALTSGSRGNLSPGQLGAIEGSLGSELTVANPEATAGGKDRWDKTPTADDRENLKTRLVSAMRESSVQELKNMLGAEDVPILSSPAVNRILMEVYDPVKDEPSDYLNLHMRLEFQAQVVDGKSLRDLASAALNANLPAGFIPVRAELKVTNLDAPTPGKDGAATWKMKAVRAIQAQLAPEQTIPRIMGLSPADASVLLKTILPLQKPPKIYIYPPWWPRMPVIPFRISVYHD